MCSFSRFDANTDAIKKTLQFLLGESKETMRKINDFFRLKGCLTD